MTNYKKVRNLNMRSTKGNKGMCNPTSSRQEKWQVRGKYVSTSCFTSFSRVFGFCRTHRSAYRTARASAIKAEGAKICCTNPLVSTPSPFLQRTATDPSILELLQAASTLSLQQILVGAVSPASADDAVPRHPDSPNQIRKYGLCFLVIWHVTRLTCRLAFPSSRHRQIRQWENATAEAVDGFATIAAAHPLDVVHTWFQVGERHHRSRRWVRHRRRRAPPRRHPHPVPRLFFMLRRFPIESKGRRKKLHEVGSVTAICFTCFLIRSFMREARKNDPPVKETSLRDRRTFKTTDGVGGSKPKGAITLHSTEQYFASGDMKRCGQDWHFALFARLRWQWKRAPFLRM
ncbi:uncharacterized protein LOC108958988 [Eucalyptus grandis]|uniref:uncharacterized protein LOC108958988 n=1 Tax=Eucalyptus grandis TaxID=71139 RepID=UPI00192F1182|nr:uncharacterized protein LOC108958988 [Eucalyptus grandis]